MKKLYLFILCLIPLQVVAQPTGSKFSTSFDNKFAISTNCQNIADIMDQKPIGITVVKKISSNSTMTTTDSSYSVIIGKDERSILYSDPIAFASKPKLITAYEFNYDALIYIRVDQQEPIFCNDDKQKCLNAIATSKTEIQKIKKEAQGAVDRGVSDLHPDTPIEVLQEKLYRAGCLSDLLLAFETALKS